jgi:hypothetical protein
VKRSDAFADGYTMNMNEYGNVNTTYLGSKVILLLGDPYGPENET